MRSTTVRDYFAERAKTYDDGTWPTDPDLLSAHLELAGDVQGKRVLDAACGTGILGACFANRGAFVVGVDNSPHMLAQAVGRLQQCVLADIVSLPIETGVFELVICRQSIQYVEPHSALGEFKRVLAGAGYLLISSIVPYGDTDKAWFTERTRIKKPEQVWVPTKDTLQGLLGECGFRCIRTLSMQTRSRLSRSIERTPHERHVRDELFRHYIGTEPSIKALYNMRFDIDRQDIEYWINWLIVLCEA